MSLTSILVVAGEASGDQIAAGLVQALNAKRADLRFFGMGGDLLAAEQVELLYRAEEISVMGFTEVLPKLPRIVQVLRGLAEAAQRRRPACAILVDVPDFNLRLAKRLKALGIPVVYYVSPMVWAWRRRRVLTVAERADRLLCILPFEPRYYRGAGIEATYVGNPVLERAPTPLTPQEYRKSLGLDPARPTLALLPGSRRGEIRRILPTLVEVAKNLSAEKPQLQVVVPVAPSIPAEEIKKAFAARGVRPLLVSGRVNDAVGASDVAVVTSGTAVLEAGLMRRPLVVVYRTSLLNYLLGKLLLKVAYIGLVNLLVGRKVVPELIQGEMTPPRIVSEVRALWQGPKREEMLQGLDEARARLGPPGASKRAAEAVLALIP